MLLINALLRAAAKRDSVSLWWAAGRRTMIGLQRVDQGRLFYDFRLEDHVPAEHLLRGIECV
ncbi:MAG: hypothetical protein WA446_04925, partial [Steroidobacteraceae bacterium]